MRPTFRLAITLLLPVAVALTGCHTGTVAEIVPTSGGGHITVPLTRNGLKPGSGGGYTVDASALEPAKEAHEAYYIFGLKTTQTPALSRIQIEDISDETAAPLVDDHAPKFTAGQWHMNTQAIAANDPRMKWIFQITPSLRVYQFTLTQKDGKQITFHHVTLYPPFVKAVIRHRWGEKY